MRNASAANGVARLARRTGRGPARHSKGSRPRRSAAARERRTQGVTLTAMAVRRARRRGIAAEDLYRLRFVSDAQISPDGSNVLYVVAWVDPDDHTRYRSQ